MKLKGLKILIPVLKFSKAGPLLSMCVSTLAYGAVFGWQFGTGMVGLIFIHELGHALMMRNLGVPAGPMVFIPFMGASVEMRKHPSNAYQEALIALAGPVLGSLGVLPIAAYGAATGSQLAFALSHFGYMINLFNLLPIGQLDGGRVAGSLNKWFLPAGLGICGSMIYFTPYCSPIMYLVFLGGAYTTYQRFFGTGDMPPYYYNMTNAQKACISAGYFGLIAALMYGMYENDKQRKSPKQLQRELGINLGGGSWGQSLINHGEGTVGGHSRGGQHSDEARVDRHQYEGLLDNDDYNVGASRALSDRSYEKRSIAAHEVESRIKQALQQRDHYGQEHAATTATIVSIITVLTSTNFTKSPYPNARKGGLLGLASVAIALENRNLDPFLDTIMAPVLYLFDDDDNRCRYYACEAMFNISKVARGLLLKGRRMCLALDGVCRLVADVDQEVKSGAQYLDRLLKDIVSDVSNKPFIIRDLPTTQQEKEELLPSSPITTSHSPELYESSYLPEGSVTSTSCDPLPGTTNNCDINIVTTPQSPALPEDPQGHRLMHLPSTSTTDQQDPHGLFDLGAFIGRIAAHLRVVNPFIKQLAMSWISVLHSLPTTRDLLLLHLPLFLGTLFYLQRDPSRGDLRHTADQVLGELLDDLTSTSSTTVLTKMGDGKPPMPPLTKLRAIVAKSVSTVVSNCSSTEPLSRLTAMNWLLAFLNTPGLLLPSLPTEAALLSMPEEEYDTPRMTMDANAAANLRALLPLLLDGILSCVDARQAEVSRKAVEAHTVLLSAVEAIGKDPTQEQSPSDDRVISVVCRYLSGPLDQTVTRACCLQWVSLLLEQSPQQMLREIQNRHHNVDAAAAPACWTRSLLPYNILAQRYFPLVCARLLELLRTNRQSVSLADDVDEDALHGGGGGTGNHPTTTGSEEDGVDVQQHNNNNNNNHTDS
ncbi:hypothetical protein Pmar_PMAR000685 [Perkinsus marinus ATCC 50983]|uniref:PtdIns(3,5)P(2) sythesis regulation factor n=1 Tax=Perkinsus marinus (strain ATCC 50983 / TXsc) TaxID=423536 RepID=C5KRH7_PERM5|nr:hypothetical protein Pmar_PMAR000685 [Perkinsus marinus ATCC 50983]EER12950.1 hypothetical protein Pmar_PMAR000685 [Perkinsus marinus ATCC 50983]|eukprot:XP_002781155.1 hypothetical protein Pmar_PMAR000685 [Perkinsus marinus ATCC 50983]